MLLAWKEWVLQADPDIITTFQVRDTLGAIRDRFERLRLEGGGLLVSRLAPVCGSGGTAATASPMTVRSVVMYSVAWVKRQGRMSSNSNQETFQADIRGRVVVDVLRQVLTSQTLATFSLVDCCQSLLGETLEVLGPFHLARLAAEAQGRQALPAPPPASPRQVAAAAAARIASYVVRRVDVIVRLTSRLATLPEAFEMARVTGLTIPQVMYNAQMIRTWSLLHRNAHRQNYIIGGRQEAGNLIESPFLMHPIENHTAGLYRSPVATLDFASLYPSLYRAYNLCYTTLVHPDDVDAVGRERCGFTPTGHAFVKPVVRQGILPTILAALMAARATTRAKLKAVKYDAAASAVLDSRQRALKITANALYGFTGAAASPLQCLPLADSCLAYGATACRAAIQTITKALEEATAAAAAAATTPPPATAAKAGPAEGAATSTSTSTSAPGVVPAPSSGRELGGAEPPPLGPAAAGGRVIYAQTDSVFVHFPRASPEEAVRLGKKAAALVTSSLPYPMELKYEKVMAPFLLLHVNRYAGRAMEAEEDAASPETRGSLLVKGVRSMWRQSAPFVTEVLQGSLERILMKDDVEAAVSYAEGQIWRLLSGRVELGELAMTGGLWRITGQQVAAAAAAAEGEGGGGGGNGGGGNGGGGGAASAEDVRGPHAALAVRLSHRDPGRRFLLGERLSYVLLAGPRTQDEAAEDPLAAAQRGAAPALELYWRNKLQPPLRELFSTCLSPAALQVGSSVWSS
ncbi:hypothetical protein Vretifemale_2820 [Volvox reticuliferus]|uniref:DNA-directed DNA polymerase n=1 Tax=Volvox reticuliferus TaxID=1737510 RepID=A0A8J4C0T4_9CHLO|nr:hypothetical protein Vretifemale_2820 [Volvox reticuliferus]